MFFQLEWKVILVLGLLLSPASYAHTNRVSNLAQQYPPYKFIESIGTVWSRVPNVYPLERIIIQEFRVKIPCLQQHLDRLKVFNMTDWESHKEAFRVNLKSLSTSIDREITNSALRPNNTRNNMNLIGDLVDRVAEVVQAAVYNGNEFFASLDQTQEQLNGLFDLVPEAQCYKDYTGNNIIQDPDMDESVPRRVKRHNRRPHQHQRDEPSHPDEDEEGTPASITNHFHGKSYVYMTPTYKKQIVNEIEQLQKPNVPDQHHHDHDPPAIVPEPAPQPIKKQQETRNDYVPESKPTPKPQEHEQPPIPPPMQSADPRPSGYRTNSAADIDLIQDDPKTYTNSSDISGKKGSWNPLSTQQWNDDPKNPDDICQVDFRTQHCLLGMIRSMQPAPFKVCSFGRNAECQELANGDDLQRYIHETVILSQHYLAKHRQRRNAQAADSKKDLDTHIDNPLMTLKPLGPPEGGIWNIALNTDVINIAKRVDLTSQAVIRNTIEIEGNKRDMIRITHAIQSEFNNVTQRLSRVANMTKLLNKNIEINMQTLSNAIGRNGEYIEWSLNLLSIFTTAIALMEQFAKAGRDLELLKREEGILLQSIRDKKLPDTTSMNLIVEKVMREISSELVEGCRISGHENLYSFFQARAHEIGYNGPYISFRYLIPITKDPELYVTYKLTSVPVAVQNVWLSFNSDASYFVINRQDGTWHRLSRDDYFICKTNPYSACLTNFPSWKRGFDECTMDYLLHDKINPKKCILKRSNVDDSVPVLVRQVDDCSYIVSTMNLTLSCNKYCDKSLFGNPSTYTDTLSGVKLVHLDPGCRWESDLFDLSCASEVLGDPASATMVQRVKAQPNNKTPRIQVRRLQPILSSESRTISWERTPMDIDDDILIHRGSINLSSLISRPQKKSFRFLDENEAIWSRYKEQGSSDSYPSFSFFSWIPSHTTVLTYYAAIMSTIIAIVLYVKRRGDVRGMSGAIAGASLMPLSPRTYAAPIGLEGLSLTQDTTPFPNNLHGNEIISNLSSIYKAWQSDINKLYHNGTNDTRIWEMDVPDVASILVQLLLMIIVHLLIAYWMIRHYHLINVINNVTNGYIPRNQATSHHAGEVALCANILIDFYKYTGQLHCSRSADLQICTLPRSYSEWYCLKRRTNATWIQSSRMRRWYSRWSLVVAWGEYCIKSRTAPKLETCQELPKVIKIDKNEILAQIQDLDTNLWTKAEAKTLVKLFLSGRGFYKEIYRAGVSEEIAQLSNSNTPLME